MEQNRTGRMGRNKGPRNKGYFFRKGRGWYATGKAPLLDEEGLHLKDRHDTEAAAKACARLLLGQPEQTPDCITVAEACDRYLDWCKLHTPDSFYGRATTLADFCTGKPRKGQRIPPRRRPEVRCPASDAERAPVAEEGSRVRRRRLHVLLQAHVCQADAFRLLDR